MVVRLQHIPFDYDNKAVFGAKVIAYLATGFAIPFVAAYYQRCVLGLFASNSGLIDYRRTKSS